jgi:hypothetical protein
MAKESLLKIKYLVTLLVVQHRIHVLAHGGSARSAT